MTAWLTTGWGGLGTAAQEVEQQRQRVEEEKKLSQEFNERAKLAAERASTSESSLRDRRAEAAKARVERRLQAEAEQTAKETRSQRRQSMEGKENMEYVAIQVRFRGVGEKLHEVLLTDEEYRSFSVRDLKQRIAAETALPSFARCSVVAETASRCLPGQILGDGELVATLLQAGDTIKLVFASARRPTTAALSFDGKAYSSRVDSLWGGALANEPPKEFLSLSTWDLQHFLEQAGLKVDQRWETKELLERAEAAVGVWEVERVLACRYPEQVLRVRRDDSATQVKRAFHKLSIAVHPDRNKSEKANEAMHRVSTAFNVLNT